MVLPGGTSLPALLGIAAISALLPADAEVTLLHVTAGDTETLARGARYALLGRSGGRPPSRAT
jgi:hypothetical protein